MCMKQRVRAPRTPLPVYVKYTGGWVGAVGVVGVTQEGGHIQGVKGLFLKLYSREGEGSKVRLIRGRHFWEQALQMGWGRWGWPGSTKNVIKTPRESKVSSSSCMTEEDNEGDGLRK